MFRIENPTAVGNDSFGNQILTLPNGNIVVGAYLDDTIEFNSGAVYVFAPSGELLHTITNPAPGANNNFGIKLSLSINKELIVSAWRNDIGAVDAGAIYIFETNNFTLLRTITNPTPNKSDYFGYTMKVAPNGDLFVGTPLEDSQHRDSGAVYQFDTNSGALLDTIFNPDPGITDHFGNAIDITPEGHIWIGAPYDDPIDREDRSKSYNAGTIYLFDGTSKELLIEISNPNIVRDDNFGSSILTLSNGDVAVGATGYDKNDLFSVGRVYLFNAGGQLIRTIENPDPVSFSTFGRFLHKNNNNDLLVSTHDTNTSLADEGLVYLIERETGAILNLFRSPTPEEKGYFGFNISLDANNDMWISAQNATSPNGTRGGAIFKLEGIATETVSDTTPPIIVTQGEQLEETLFNTGITVDYPPVFAADNIGVPLYANCNPISGSLFPVGRTLVTCTAQDLAGNTGNANFEVNVYYKIPNPAPTHSPGFGATMEKTSQGNILLGLATDKNDANNAGLAFVIDETGNLIHTIHNPEVNASDYFGRSVAVTPDGDFLIGAERDDFGAVDAGSVYLFDHITGELKLTIRNPDPQQTDYFGYKVATLPNGNFVISASHDNATARFAGSVYVFDGTGTLLYEIPNPNPLSTDFFGIEMTITPDGKILVGRPDGDFNLNREGEVFVYDGETGELLFILKSPNAHSGDNFGRKIVAADNSNFLVSAYLDSTYEENSGAAYLFDKNGNLLNSYFPQTPKTGQLFAANISFIDNETIGIQEPVNTPDIRSNGTLHVFSATTGELIKSVKNPTPVKLDGFGTKAIRLSDGNLMISASFKDKSGALYIYDGSALVADNDDTIPPVISVPDDLVIEATGPDGAMVDYIVSATDNVGVVTGPECIPASGDIFAIGNTAVVCTAQDAAGNETTESFNVLVQDTTPPELTVPFNITAEATGPDGATVNYAIATAYDLVGVLSGPDCMPLSGDLYPIGDTLVTCSAVDEAGNVGSGIFTILVQDTTAPDTSIVVALDGDGNEVQEGEFTLSNKLALEFLGSDSVTLAENLRFECRLDGGIWQPCTSPVIYQDLEIGEHVIEISAIDEAGNIESDVASYNWSVVTAEDAIENAVSGLEELLLDPVSTQAGNKLQNAINKATEALELSQQIPIDYTSVARKIEQAVKQIDDAIKFGTPVEAVQPILKQLATVTREMAKLNIESAISQGGNIAKIDNAQAYFSSANESFTAENYQAAIDSYLAASQEADKA